MVPTDTAPDGARTLDIACGEAVGRLLREEDSPRWVMLLSGSVVHLFDRTSFAQGRWVSFDLDGTTISGSAKSNSTATACMRASTAVR